MRGDFVFVGFVLGIFFTVLYLIAVASINVSGEISEKERQLRGEEVDRTKNENNQKKNNN
jgi:hypothetical protein